MHWPRNFAPSVPQQRNWQNSGSWLQNNGPRIPMLRQSILRQSIPHRLVLHRPSLWQLRQKNQNSVLPMKKPRLTSAGNPALCHRVGHHNGPPCNSPSFRHLGPHWVGSPGCHLAHLLASSPNTGPSRRGAIPLQLMYHRLCSSPSGALMDPCRNRRQGNPACNHPG